MTADSLPPQKSKVFGVEPKAAADLRLVGDLMAGLSTGRQPHGDRPENGYDLDVIQRIFGRAAVEGPAAHEVTEARARAAMRAAAGGRVTASIALSFAADVFVALAVERPWPVSRVRDL